MDELYRRTSYPTVATLVSAIFETITFYLKRMLFSVLSMTVAGKEALPDATGVRRRSAAVAGHRARRGRQGVPAVAGPRGRRERTSTRPRCGRPTSSGLDRADRRRRRGRTGHRARGAGPRHRSDAVPGDDDAVRAAGGGPLRPAARVRQCSRRRHRAPRRRRLGARRHRHATSSTATGPSGSRWSPTAGCSSSRPPRRSRPAHAGVRPGPAHRRRDLRRRAGARRPTASPPMPERRATSH